MWFEEKQGYPSCEENLVQTDKFRSSLLIGVTRHITELVL